MDQDGGHRFTLLYRDSWYVAVDKPSGWLVHRTAMAGDRRFVLQELRNQLGRRVYPIHRLDRATSGVLVFALASEPARALGELFEVGRVAKGYIAVVRGHPDAEGVIDHPLREGQRKERKPARTRYRCLATTELAIPVGRYATARYALVEAHPETGRTHQLRKHFDHIAHPIVGDTTYGDGRHNRLFRSHLHSHRLLLMARWLAFRHPYTGETITLKAPIAADFAHPLHRLGWDPSLLS